MSEKKCSEKPYRDGVFRDYYNDKRRLLDLCNALTGEDATDPDEIVINTLDGIFFDNFKNDISCLFRGKLLVIIEHQSTINENMPLRMLFYAAEILKQHVDSDDKSRIYRKPLIRLPAPRFFVFYNGKKEYDEQKELRLSEAFMLPSPLELTLRVYNINAGMNAEFLRQVETLQHYCIFIDKVEEFRADGMDFEHAVAEAFDYCLKHDIMAEYLKLRRKELASMLRMEYDAELAREALIEQGREEGHEEGVIDVAKNLLAMNFSTEDIMKATGWTEEKILSLVEK